MPQYHNTTNELFGNIPPELKALPNWVVWKLTTRKGEDKPTKIPFNPTNGKAANTTNAATWGTFDQALKAYATGKYTGLGFVFTNTPFTGIDLDHCIENGTIAPWALEIVNDFSTYTEITPSDTGLHLIAKGTIPAAYKHGDTEMYTTGRYFTMTGNKLGATPSRCEDRQPELDAMYAKLNPPKPAPAPRPAAIPLDKTDAELLEVAKNATNGAKFSALWAGNWESLGYTSQSEADQAFCNSLAFYWQRDATAIDRMFRQSGLMREKWERQDYRESTINNAINSNSDTYQPHRVTLRNVTNNAQKDEQPAKNWRETMISHGELMQQEYAPLEFAIDGVAPCPGLVMFSGKKKLGKSWLVMQMARNKAKGEPFLGMNTTQSSVLYLAIEDGARRLQARQRLQGGTELDLPITYITSLANPLNTAHGKRDFIEMIKETDAAFIIIDTLKKAVTGMNGKWQEDSSGDSGDLFNWLHDITIEYNVTIVIVHHHGKARRTIEERDAGFDARGSSAFGGATDANIALYRNDDKTYDLLIEARDFDESEIRISFDKGGTFNWHYDGSASDARTEQSRQDVMKALQQIGEADATMIADTIGKTLSGVNMTLKGIRDDEDVRFIYKWDTKKWKYNINYINT